MYPILRLIKLSKYCDIDARLPFSVKFEIMTNSLTLWCLRAIQVDSPPPLFAATNGDLSRHNNS